jgi:hypothetical protein
LQYVTGKAVDMTLEEALRNNRYKIVDRWVAYTLTTYEASSFFLKEKDAFANPIGATVRDALKKLFALLMQDAESEQLKEPLSRMMHLRSVQDFSPAQAVAPLNAVKHITREVLAADKETAPLTAELYDFEFRVDLAMLAAFDLYVACREKIYQLRIDEIKSGKHTLTDGGCPSQALKNIAGTKG